MYHNKHRNIYLSHSSNRKYYVIFKRLSKQKQQRINKFVHVSAGFVKYKHEEESDISYINWLLTG